MADMNEIFGSDSDNEENQHEEEQAEEEEEAEQEEEQEEAEVEAEEEADQENDNEDDDDDEIVRKKAPKTADVFGDELADLSEDENENQSENNEEEEQQTASQSRHLIHDEEEEEIEPEQVISIEIPRVKTDLGKDVHFVKLPNFLSVEPRPFDPDTYEDETPKGDTLDEEGKTRVRLKVENTIRWRYEKDEEGNVAKQSNARIVKWSDGSLSMYLGNEIFDVYKTLMQGDHNHLFVRQNNVLHGQTVFKTKLTFRPHSTDSMTHRKMTMSLVDRGSKTKKVKILAEMKKNPEFKRLELMKKEEEKLKAASRRQNQQRRIREKSHSKGISSNYLEDKYEDEDDEMSLNAIKNKFKSRKNNKASLNSSSDESDRERRLNKSKKHLDDDDDDEEEEDEEDFDDDDEEDEEEDLNRSKKSSSNQKNKKKKNVVSDDDDE